MPILNAFETTSQWFLQWDEALPVKNTGKKTASAAHWYYYRFDTCITILTSTVIDFFDFETICDLNVLFVNHLPSIVKRILFIHDFLLEMPSLEICFFLVQDDLNFPATACLLLRIKP